MRPHWNAKGNPYQRKLMIRRVEQGLSVAEASAAAGWSERTGHKWLQRWRADGEAGLRGRRSGPRRVRNRTPGRKIEKILLLQRKGQTGWEIAKRLGMPWSTVSGILRREGVGKLSPLKPKEPPGRYQREVDGELVHFDVKPLRR